MGSDAQGDVLYFNGTNYVRLPAGTSGNFLKTLGAGANPAWAAVPGGGDVLAANNGTEFTAASFATNLALVRTVKKQPFTSSGTYTPSTGMLFCIIECWGGGGGGGGASGAVSQFYIGAGGGTGGYSRLVATAAMIGASKTVTVGAAGNGGAPGTNNGSAGGDTSVGAICIAKGGSGGLFSSVAQVGTGGLGGVAGTGDIAAPGAPGQGGFYNGTNANIIHTSGAGGNTVFGGGGVGQNAASTAVTGATATGYGSGGGGASVGNSATSAGGGGGFTGYVFIYEFCTQ
jgi:hypothetical protein